MGRGSSDPILNKMMPKKAILSMSNVLEIVLTQPCRDEIELVACQNLQTTLEFLLDRLDQSQKAVLEGLRIIEEKIKAYKEEL